MSEIERCLYCGVRRLFFLISFSIVHVLSLTELNLGRVNEIELRKVQTIPGSKPSLPRLRSGGKELKGDETEAKIGERREPEQAVQAIINLACNSTMAHNLFV